MGQTRLYQAARNGHNEVVAALLAVGAAVDRADMWGVTSLQQASLNGHTNVVATLRASVAAVDAASETDDAQLLSSMTYEVPQEPMRVTFTCLGCA